MGWTQLFCREEHHLFAREFKYSVGAKFTKSVAQVLCYDGHQFTYHVAASLTKTAGKTIQEQVLSIFSGYNNVIGLYAKRSIARGNTGDVGRQTAWFSAQDRCGSQDVEIVNHSSTEGWWTAVRLGFESEDINAWPNGEKQHVTLPLAADSLAKEVITIQHSDLEEDPNPTWKPWIPDELLSDEEIQEQNVEKITLVDKFGLQLQRFGCICETCGKFKKEMVQDWI
ncbi:hypothetical protein DFH07DRAFT_767785 [Mycena maculata]|uniref:Uncharacterized protein n=1 Tax=Mycena maculata TaxID=230809 RepID=A0AAD7NS48_9AGAR|nr:hypothetical protein DFH07DRAFT_767785 [Mycena maculata]